MSVQERLARWLCWKLTPDTPEDEYGDAAVVAVVTPKARLRLVGAVSEASWCREDTPPAPHTVDGSPCACMIVDGEA